MSSSRGALRAVRLAATDGSGLGANGLFSWAFCAVGHARLKGYFRFPAGTTFNVPPQVVWFTILTGTAGITRVLQQDPAVVPDMVFPLAMDASGGSVAAGLPVEGMYCAIQVNVLLPNPVVCDRFFELLPG